MTAINYPRISVITPSYNQAEYLEQTICSVLDQGYPDLEYIIIDGGSSDGSVEIIKRYASHLKYWVSEKDNGQTEAINKGLKRATGVWIAWQNSDDIYYPGAFKELVLTAANHPSAELIVGDMMLIDENGDELRDIKYVKPSYKAMLAEGMVIANQAAFWHRSLHEKIGLLNQNFDFAFDYDWFLRIAEVAEGKHVNQTLGAFRLHSEAKTSQQSGRFQEENNIILDGRNLPKWEVWLYRLRRVVLMLLNGNFKYVMRGLLKHSRGKGKESY